MADVADMTQGEIDELLEGGDSNEAEIVVLDDDAILNGDNFDQDTKDSDESEKLQICEEKDPGVSRDCPPVIKGSLEVDTATELVKDDEKTSTNGVKLDDVEDVTVLDSDNDDDDCINVEAGPSTSYKLRRKEAAYTRYRNIAQKMVTNSLASSDSKANAYTISLISKAIKTSHEGYTRSMENLSTQVSQLVKYTEHCSAELEKEKQARNAMKYKVTEVKKEIEELKNKFGLQQAKRPIVQPLNTSYPPPDHQIHNFSQYRPQQHPYQQHQQQQQHLPRQIPCQFMVHPPNHITPKNVINNYNSPPNQIRKRTSDHFPAHNDPRKNIRMDYPMMSNPRDLPPSQHHPPQLHSQQLHPQQLNPQSAHNNSTPYQFIDTLNRGRVYGHTQQSQNYRILLDAASTSSRDIVCLVPHVPKHKLNLDRKLNITNKPTFFKKYGSIRVIVKIKSTKQDFSDSWQIAGLVNYSNVPNFCESTVQLYIQIQSMLPNLHGIIPQNNELIDWGNSNVLNCHPSGKTKFRIKFHKEQQMISEDHITVFAVVSRDSVIDVAAAVSLQYR